MRVKPCKLTQLESEVFGLPREDDLPGSEVPARYFTYIKTGEEALLDDIIEHNARDIVSMARLLYALVNLHERPLEAADQRDLYSLGRVLEKRGEKEQAKACFRLCRDGSVRELAQLRLADMYRREGKIREAAAGYEHLRSCGRGGARVYIALAKLYEHRFREPARALAIVRRGMIYCLEAPDGGGPQSREYQDLLYRSRRLINKIGG
jgi:tetratricopeptide (TPR) repeat protein